jgi:catalase
MEKVGAFLAEHPETIPAVTAAITALAPTSYAQTTYHALHAYRFIAADGTVRHGRYHFVPAAGEASISDEDASSLAPDYLRAELEERLSGGPVAFELQLEVAASGDPVDDPTAAWPEDRERVTLGTIELTALAFDRENDDDILVFDPTRVVDGIELTGDPILLARPGAYSVSVARRTAVTGG